MAKSSGCSFYLSAVTPLGFVSRTKELIECNNFERVVLLKGATSGSRGELLKQAAEEAEQKGLAVKRVLSAVDPGALEAVFFEGCAVIDGDAPYNLEPPFCGGPMKVLWLGDCIDEQKLASQSGELAKLHQRERQLFESGRQFLFSADRLLCDSRRAVAECCDSEKIKRQALRLADRFIKGGGEERFFITCGRLGAEGITADLADFTVTELRDKEVGCAGLFMNTIYAEAKRRGCGFIAGFGPLFPYAEPELLLFPETGQAVVCAEGCFNLSRPADKVIISRRFADKERLAAYKKHIRFDRKAAERMLLRSGELFGEAAALRNEISRRCGEAADGRLLWQPRRRLSDLIF